MESLKENDVLVMGWTDPNLDTTVEEFVNASGKHLVRLDDKVITDYIKGIAKHEETANSVSSFLKNEKNRNEAEVKALSLFNLVTHNGDILKEGERVFKKSEIVKKTNLTNKTLGELLTLFSLFGLIEYTKGDYEFRFIFDKEVRRSMVLSDITNTITMLNQNIIRYLTQFDDKEKDEKLKEIREQTISSILK